MSRVRTVLVVLLSVLLVILAIPLFLICALFRNRELPILFGKWGLKLVRPVLGIKIAVEGKQRFHRRSAYVFMSNHLSFLDGPLLVMLIPQQIRVIMKKSIFGIPVLGPAMRFVGFVPVDRKRILGGKQSVDRAAALMRDRGYSYLIFPEGTRSRDGHMLPLRRGGFFLALESGAPIVPVHIRGTFELMPKGQWHARAGQIRVVFHDPIPVSGYRIETMPGLMEKVREAIAAPDG
jgi:1-acyl-sn-glycerol-3-phosphate acyltransferase